MILTREKLNSYSTFDAEYLLHNKEKACVPGLPARYVFAAMSMLGITFAYVMRACLSMAITEMVISNENNIIINHTIIDLDGEICPSSDDDTPLTTVAKVGAEFDWDEKTQGIILSAFYYGYILTHIPGGLLSQRFGGKHVFGLGILSTALFTLLTPIVSRGAGATGLITLRFLEGLGEGVTFPALCTMLAQWAPPSEKSTLTTATFAGVQIGAVIANLIGGIILEYVPGGWAAVFYIFGGVTVVWFLLWCPLCYNDPSSHPFISENERSYLKKAIGQTERKNNLKMPWRAILTSIPVWGLIVAEVGHDWALYTIVTDLPKYMSDVMKFNPAENGFWSSMPYLANWVTSLVASTFADWLEVKNCLSFTNLRKLFATVGAVGPAIGVIAASYVGCDKMLALLMLTIGMGLMGFVYCSLRVNALDLSPNYSGTIMAFVNGIGCISGMITPIFTGILTPHGNLKEWKNVFWIMAIILLSTNFVFLLAGSGDLQDWNEPAEDNRCITKKHTDDNLVNLSKKMELHNWEC